MAVNMGAFGAAPSSSTTNTGSVNLFDSGIGGLNTSGGTNTGFGTTTNTGFGAPATGTNTNNTGFGTPTGTNSGFGAQAMTSGGAQNQPLYTSLGAPGQWNIGTTPFGAPAFVRGNEYVVSDEIFWNPDTPMGANLRDIVSRVQAGGGQAGLTFSPYALYSPTDIYGKPLLNPPSIQQVLDEIKNSGVNFVALDPYLYGDNLYTPEQGIEWTRQAVEALKSIGVDPRIVTQNFYSAGMDPDVVRRYNAALAAIPGVSESTLFMEGVDWEQFPNSFNLTNPYGYETPQAPANLTPAQAQRYLQLTGSDQGLYSALASAYGSPGSVAEDAAAVRNVMAQNNITVQDIARLMNVPASEISAWLDTNAPLAMPTTPVTLTQEEKNQRGITPDWESLLVGGNAPDVNVPSNQPTAADITVPTAPVDLTAELENIITGNNVPDINVPNNQPTAADITVPTAPVDLTAELENILTGGSTSLAMPRAPVAPRAPVVPRSSALSSGIGGLRGNEPSRTAQMRGQRKRSR